MVICLERGAELHVAQLMPLPLTVSCFSKIQIGFTFLVRAHPGSPGKGPLNVCACVCPRLRRHTGIVVTLFVAPSKLLNVDPIRTAMGDRFWMGTHTRLAALFPGLPG